MLFLQSNCVLIATLLSRPIIDAASPHRREAGASDAARGRPGSTLLNSSDPFYKEFRDLPYYITSQRCGKLVTNQK
jgi:hypothetical protein